MNQPVPAPRAEAARHVERGRSLDLWRRVTLQNVRSDEPDLTARQTAVLLTVYLAEGPHTVRALAATLNVTKPAITRAIDTLSSHDLVRRERSAADRRDVFIRRTVRGADFLSGYADRISDAARYCLEPRHV